MNIDLTNPAQLFLALALLAIWGILNIITGSGNEEAIAAITILMWFVLVAGFIYTISSLVIKTL